MARFDIRFPGGSKRTTSAQTAAAFRASYERRKPARARAFCCARYEWGDRTHDLVCRRYREAKP